jgi:hypothetical protein
MGRDHRSRLEPPLARPPYTPGHDIAAYGKGHAAEKAVELILHFLKN